VTYEDVNSEISAIVNDVLAKRNFPTRIYRNDVDFEVRERFNAPLSNQRRRNLVTQSIKSFNMNGFGYVDNRDRRESRTRNREFVRVEKCPTQ